MEFPQQHRDGEKASVLMVTLVVTSVIGFILASYLILVRAQTVSVSRSQSWNSALVIAEAGIEEALAHMNPGVVGGPFSIGNLSANGWTSAGGAFVGPRRFLSGGYYDVYITNAPGPTPTVVSKGVVTNTFTSAVLSRSVMVTLSNTPLFTTAMLVKETVDFKGANIETDSYNSSDPRYSTGGRYDPSKSRDMGDVSSASQKTNAIAIGNAKIKGKLVTNPLGKPSLGPNASVGSKFWVDSGYVGVEPGWHRDDYNAEFFDVTAPYTSGTTPTGQSISGVDYTYVLGSANYYVNGAVRMQTKDKMLVVGNASLYVTGDFDMNGAAEISVASGASLKVYVAGSTTTFTYVNNGGNPTNFQYYGLPTNKSISFGGNNEVVASVYAPQADISMGGGGSEVYDMQGAIVVQTIRLNGKYKYHFDENLLNSGPKLGYIVTSWSEL